MALIKCSECGKEISDKAKACPNCGLVFPENTRIKQFGRSINSDVQRFDKLMNKIIIWLIPLVIVVVIIASQNN